MSNNNVYCERCNNKDLNTKIHCGIPAICNHCKKDCSWGGLYIKENTNKIPLLKILYVVRKYAYQVSPMQMADLSDVNNPFIPWSSTLNGDMVKDKLDSEVDAVLASYHHAQEQDFNLTLISFSPT